MVTPWHALDWNKRRLWVGQEQTPFPAGGQDAVYMWTEMAADVTPAVPMKTNTSPFSITT